MLLPLEQHSQVVRTSLHLFMFTRNSHYNKSVYEYAWPRHFGERCSSNVSVYYVRLHYVLFSQEITYGMYVEVKMHA